MSGPGRRRTVVVIRHAHAGESRSGDHERPLDGRGRREATSAGRWLATTGLHIDIALVSSAVRTRQTWNLLSDELDGAPHATIEPRIYNCDVDELIDLLGEPRAQLPVVAVVGHNPAVSQLAWFLEQHDVDHNHGAGLPPGAVMMVEAVIGAAPGRVIASWAPAR